MPASASVRTGAVVVVEEVVVVVLVAAGDAPGADCTTSKSLALPGSLETAGGFAAGLALAAGAGLVCACNRDNALSNAAVTQLNRVKVVTIIIFGMR